MHFASESRQTQKAEDCMFPLIEHSGKAKLQGSKANQGLPGAGVRGGHDYKGTQGTFLEGWKFPVS